MTKLFDTNHDVSAKLPALKAAGIETVIRYIGASGSEKYIKPAEAARIAAAGLRLGLVFEVWGGSNDFSHHDINAQTGSAHGAFAKQYVTTLGAPSTAVIYFALDTDASEAQIKDLVLPYLAAAKAALGGTFRMGVYGCGAVCKAALDGGIVDKAWLSNAMGWNGSRDFRASGREAILQHLPANIAGLDTDPDDKVGEGADIGDFVPFAVLPPNLQGAPMPNLRSVTVSPPPAVSHPPAVAPTPAPITLPAAPSKPVIMATGATATVATAAHHNWFPPLSFWSANMSVIVEFVLAGIVAYLLIEAAQDYYKSSGTIWQRLLAVGKQSATVLWARFCAVIAGISGVLVWAADTANAPGVAGAIQAILQPQYVAILTIVIAVVTELARRRTLPPPPPMA